jgi:hypothetical protein
MKAHTSLFFTQRVQSMFRLSFQMVALTLLCCGWMLACTPEKPQPKDECSVNSDCKDISQVCKSKKCVTASCKTNNDCRTGASCNLEKETCQKEPYNACKANADCDSGKVCDSGKCVEGAACSEDSDCTDAAKPRCDGSKCVEGESCSSDTDCKNAKRGVCLNGRCGACTKDDDCKSSTRTSCKSGRCVEPPPECTKNEDCTNSDKPVCKSRKCVADPGKDIGETCENTFACKVTLFCFREDRDAKLGVCSKRCDITKGDCPSERVCLSLDNGYDGVCVTKNNGAKEGETCNETSKKCERDLRCVQWKQAFACARPCNPKKAACGVDEECYPVRKGKEVCVSKRAPCGPGRPCKNDKDFCENGLCTPPPSCDDVTCKDTEVCENGSCRPRKCPNEKDCKPWEDCANGACVPKTHADPPCTTCTSNTDCGPGGVCLRLDGGGKSYCFASCASTACADTKNFYCRTVSYNNGRSCTSDATCKVFGQEYSCVSGTCSVENAKHCWPRIGTCVNKCKSVTCNPPQVCVPSVGTCVTTGKKACSPCKYNEECGGVRDLCLSFSNGKAYCATDCSKPKATCPLNQRCYTLNDNVNKQCAPASNPQNGCTP